MYKIQLLNNDGSISSIYDQSRVNERSVSAPTCSLSINEAGTLEFTLTKNHPFINALEPLSSFISVLDDGEEIFYGRVLKRSDPTLTGMVTFNCEGALTFLLDSEIPPDGKDGNGNQITRNLTAQQFFEWCITTHNSEVDDSRRQFTVGTVNADQRYKVDTYSISNYTQTKSAIENQILDVYGGFIRIRPKNGGGHYIDWIQNYETLNPQPVQIGNNIEDQTNETDGSDLFTVLRPVGKDGITLDTPTIDLYPSELMNKYGRIVKTIEFKSATTKAELQTQANDYKQRIEKTLYINSSIQLVDLHYLDGTKPKIRLGDRFNNINGLEGTEVVVSSIELHFEAPQNDTIELKNRKSLDPDLTPEGNRHNGKNSYTKRGSKKESQYFKYLKEYEDTLEVLAPKVYMHGELLQQHYERIEQQAGYYESLSSRADSADEVISSHTETVNNIEQTIRDVVGSARIQDGYTLTDIVGKFEIWEDQNGHVTVHLKDGAALTLDDTNGQTVTVGTRLSEVYNSTNNMNQFVQNFHGSTLWTQRDNITGIVGHFTEVDTVVPDPDHPGQYKTVKKLVVESGGGFQIREDGVEYGLYMTPESAYNEVSLAAGANPQAKGLYEKLANGTYVLTSDTTVQSGKKYYKRGGNAVLTAGMIVDKINNETVTKIQGDRVNIVAKNVKITADKGLETIVGHWEEEEYLMEDGSHHPIIDPETGEQLVGKRLVYKADGGMRVRRLRDDGMQAEFGVYDDGNLTGGILVEKINGQTTSYIRGDRIIIGNIDGNDLDTWASGAEGLIASKASIYQLNAVRATVSDLEALVGNIEKLSSSIGRINALTVKALFTTGMLTLGSSSGGLTINGPNSGQSVKMTYTTLKGTIKEAKVLEDTNTLRLTRYDGTSIDFNKATPLSEEWSGTNNRTYTVIATQSGIETDRKSVTTSVTSDWEGNTFKVTLAQGSQSLGTVSALPQLYLESSQGSAYLDASIATFDSGGHATVRGNKKRLYIVKNGNTISVRDQDSTTTGSVYAMKTITDYADGQTAEAGSLTVYQPSVNESSLSASSTRTSIKVRSSAKTTNSSTKYSTDKTLTLTRWYYTNSSGTENQRCVELRDGNTTIGRIDVMQDYNLGYSAGQTAEANGLTVYAPSVNESSLSANYTRTSIKVRSSAKTTNSSTQYSTNKTLTLTRWYYTNSSGTENQRCVELRDGNTTIGRIDVMEDYNFGYSAGQSAGRTAEAGSLTVYQPSVNESSLSANYTRTSIKVRSSANTTNSSTQYSTDKTLTLTRWYYTNNAGQANQRCIELRDGNTAIGRIDVMEDYYDGYDAGSSASQADARTAEANSLTVYAPSVNESSLSANSERTSIKFRSSAKTANSSTKYSNDKVFSLTRWYYTNSDGTENQRCVELRDGNTAIGRIDVMQDYNLGYSAGQTAGYSSGKEDGKAVEADSLTVYQPSVNEESLGANSTRTSINFRSSAKTTNSDTKYSTDKTFSLTRWYYTNSNGTENQRCVELRDGNTTIGRIDVMQDYNLGYSSGYSIGYDDGYDVGYNDGKALYPNTISIRQVSGYASARKMVMYFQDNTGAYHAAANGASLYWYYSAGDMNNTGSYKTVHYS